MWVVRRSSFREFGFSPELRDKLFSALLGFLLGFIASFTGALSARGLLITAMPLVVLLIALFVFLLIYSLRELFSYVIPGILMTLAIPAYLLSLAGSYFLAGNMSLGMGLAAILVAYLQVLLLWAQTELWMWRGDLEYEPRFRIEVDEYRGGEAVFKLCNRGSNPAYEVMVEVGSLMIPYFRDLESISLPTDLDPNGCKEIFAADLGKIREIFWGSENPPKQGSTGTLPGPSIMVTYNTIPGRRRFLIMSVSITITPEGRDIKIATKILRPPKPGILLNSIEAVAYMPEMLATIRKVRAWEKIIRRIGSIEKT